MTKTKQLLPLTIEVNIDHILDQLDLDDVLKWYKSEMGAKQFHATISEWLETD